MKVNKYLLGISILFFSCKSNNQESAVNNLEPVANNSITLQDSLNASGDSLTRNEFEVVFNEANNNLVIKLAKEPQKEIAIGSYHNTFNQPPHEIKIENLGRGNYAILVFTNQVQMGISEDHINAFCFNVASRKVAKVCSFDNLGVYSEESGIDTLIDIKLYDFRVTKIKSEDSFKLEVTNYEPFKYRNENKNKGLNIKAYVRECTFSLCE